MLSTCSFQTSRNDKGRGSFSLRPASGCSVDANSGAGQEIPIEGADLLGRWLGTQMHRARIAGRPGGCPLGFGCCFSLGTKQHDPTLPSYAAIVGSSSIFFEDVLAIS